MSKKKIVLRIITRLNNGGPAKQAVWLSGLMDKNCFETILLAGINEGDEDDISWYARKYNVSPVIIPYLRRSVNLFRDIFSFIKILHVIIRIRPDIVHTHMSKAGFIGRGAAILFNLFHRKKIVTIHTFHGHVFHSYFSGIKTRLFICLEKILARKTDSLICISPRLKNEIQHIVKISNCEKFQIIPLGIDYKPLRKKNSRESQHANFTVGMLGRIAPIKNYNLAMEIARVLAGKKIPANILIGGGGSADDFKALRQFQLSNVSFLGNVEDPREFWDAVDIAMITSKNEGTPVSLIEAMFSGLPFVASEVGGIPDMAFSSMKMDGNLLVYGNCILIRGFDPEDFVRAIHCFTDSEFRRTAGALGEKHASEKYSISRLIRDMETLYKQVLKYE